LRYLSSSKIPFWDNLSVQFSGVLNPKETGLLQFPTRFFLITRTKSDLSKTTKRKHSAEYRRPPVKDRRFEKQ
jgi:hypothetical protein